MLFVRCEDFTNDTKLFVSFSYWDHGVSTVGTILDLEDRFLGSSSEMLGLGHTSFYHLNLSHLHCTSGTVDIYLCGKLTFKNIFFTFLAYYGIFWPCRGLSIFHILKL